MSENLRPAAVAGMFYPNTPAALSRDVTALLVDVPRHGEAPPKAIIAPAQATI